MFVGTRLRPTMNHDVTLFPDGTTNMTGCDGNSSDTVEASSFVGDLLHSALQSLGCLRFHREAPKV